MSQNWKKRQWGVFRPQLESLESREVPAGNIRTLVSDGILFIRTDNDDFHAFSISGAGRNAVVIRPEVGTTINGRADAIYLGNVRRGIDIQTGNGADSVIISGVKVTEFLSIVTNGGDDAVHVVNSTDSRRSTQIRTGDGNDVVVITDSKNRRHFALDTGSGDDRVTVNGTRFGGPTFFQGGDGSNKLQNGSTNRFDRTPAIANFTLVPTLDVSPNPITAPTANDDQATVQKSSSVTINVLANDQPGTGTLDFSSVTITANPSAGTAKVNADGTITYTNSGGSSTSDALRYTVRNSAGATSNVATVNITITADTTGPTVTLSSTSSDPTRTSPIPFTATFSENVTGFTLGDITITNGTASNLVEITAKQYNFDVTPTAEGTVTVNILAGAATDSSGNPSQASNTLSRVFDKTAPTITINPLTTNNKTPSITGTVSEPNTTVVVTVNGQTSNAVVTGTSYSATLVTPLADGTYSISVTATDAAGNVGTQQLADGLTVDTVAPTVTISSTASDPTTTAPIPIVAKFSEAVTGFVAGDVTIGNGTISAFTTTDNITFSFNVTPTAKGAVTVAIPLNAAQDAAGNGNTASDTFTITFNGDPSAPSVALTTPVSNPTNKSPFRVTATFTEDVTGFAIEDLSLTNATASNFTAESGSVYSFDITPIGQGLVTVGVPAGVAQDIAGNANNASELLSITFDSIAPLAELDRLFTNDTTPTVTGTVNEENTSIQVIINGQTVQAVVTGKTFTATFTSPFAEGTYSGTVIAKDAAGNSQPSIFPDTLIIDTTAPSVTIGTTSKDPTNLAPITFLVSFSEAVTGFEIDDITVTNGTVTGFLADDESNFTIEVTPTDDGTVTIFVAAGKVTDLAGNANTASDPFSVVFDNTAPTAKLSTTASSPTNLEFIPFSIRFSEVPVGFDVSDIVVINGTASDLLPGVDAKNFSFTVTPAGDGEVIVSVPAGAFTDLAGNANLAVEPLSIVSERLSPTGVFSSTASPATNTSPIPFTVTFSENVTGFELADIVVVNGTAGEFVEVTGKLYTFTVTPLAEGQVIVSAAAGAAKDAAGNDSEAIPEFRVVFDTTAPTGVITTSASSPSNLAEIPFTITFSEAVVGLTAADFTVVNGTVVNLVQGIDASIYTFDIIPAADGNVTVSLAADKVSDVAGNGNTAVDPVTIVSERLNPTGVISSSASNPTNAADIPFEIVFSEDVTGFELSDLVVVNGTAGNLVMVDAKTYTFTISPISDGDVTVSLPAGSVTDAAGNGNDAVDAFTIVSDRLAPAATLTTPVSSPSNLDEYEFTITFTEDVTGFELADIVVVNGTASNFVEVDAKTYTFTVSPTADGDVTVSVPSGAAVDAAGNGNSPVAPVTIVSDRTGPGITISSPITSPSNLDTFTYTVTLTEAIVGFDIDDISVVNGTAGDFMMVDSLTYTFTVTPTADGIVRVEIAAGAGTDALGNPSTASNVVEIVSDRTAPSATINYTNGSPTKNAPLLFTVVFSEDVTGFEVSDLVVSNGLVGNFMMIDGSTYTFEVAPIADGDVVVMLGAAVAVDAAGNDNTAAADVTVIYDTTAPAGTIDPTGTGSITGTATDIHGVASVKISIFNGTFFWDGIGFNSAVEIFFDVTTNDAFATWAFDFAEAGTFDVTAQITDLAGNVSTVSETVTLS